MWYKNMLELRKNKGTLKNINVSMKIIKLIITDLIKKVNINDKTEDLIYD